jgi:hypothetical protein
MATSDGRWFVYVRYWPGFTEDFPYERFNELPDGKVDTALRAALAKELWKRHEEIRTLRRSRKQRVLEAIKRRRSQVIPRYPGPLRHDEPPRTKPPKTRCSRFARLGWYVGWHEQGGYLLSKSGEYLFTPRIWIADTEATCAHDLVNDLTKLPSANDEERERRQAFNPRFGLVFCAELSRGEQASALAEIQQLWSNEPMDWADLIRPLLPRVKRFLDAWRVVAQPTATDAIASGDQVASTGEAGSRGTSAVKRVLSDESETGNWDNREHKLSKLQPCARKAYFSYQLAESQVGRRLEDDEAYDWLKENGLPDDAGDLGELTDYELSSRDTWKRELRSARKALGEQKYSRRAGRSTGRSVVGADEI